MQGLENMPKKYEKTRQTFKDLHPDWEFKFWDEPMLRDLAKNTDWEKPLKMCRKMIQRADILRCMVLYEFGGVYADMDMIAIQNLDGFLDKGVQAGYSSLKNSVLSLFMGSVNNGILFSPKHDPFWIKDFLPEVCKRLHMQTILDDIFPAYNVLRTTGPLLWSSFSIQFHPQNFFYSLSVLKKTEIGDEERDILLKNGAYVYHAQDSMWLNSWEKYLLFLFIGNNWIITLCFSVLIIFLYFKCSFSKRLSRRNMFS